MKMDHNLFTVLWCQLKPKFRGRHSIMNGMETGPSLSETRELICPIFYLYLASRHSRYPGAVHRAGELVLVEYGRHEVLGSCPTPCKPASLTLGRRFQKKLTNKASLCNLLRRLPGFLESIKINSWDCWVDLNLQSKSWLRNMVRCNPNCAHQQTMNVHPRFSYNGFAPQFLYPKVLSA